MTVIEHDPYRVALEIRERLASGERRLAFFFGAGTSIALGIPDIKALTTQVEAKLQEPYKTQYGQVKTELGAACNVEQVLDRVRLYRELIGDTPDKQHSGIKGKDQARDLDNAVCRAIVDIVKEPAKKDIQSHRILAQWIAVLHTRRVYPLEIFTTNYDVILEQAFEETGVPFFDGFVGSVNPFFAPECVEAEDTKEEQIVYPPRSWTRLWKLHGSINWRIRKDPYGSAARITRVSSLDTTFGEDDLIVFPSREKYTESRKLPFLSFQDRLRKFLSRGECLLLVIGYSFSDQHLNEILFQGLRANPRLAIDALIFGIEASDKILNFGKQNRNLSVYGPDRACIGGVVGAWSEPSEKRDEWPFWNKTQKRFTLGDFNSFASFLELFIGFQGASRRPTES